MVMAKTGRDIGHVVKGSLLKDLTRLTEELGLARAEVGKVRASRDEAANMASKYHDQLHLAIKLLKENHDLHMTGACETCDFINGFRTECYITGCKADATHMGNTLCEEHDKQFTEILEKRGTILGEH